MHQLPPNEHDAAALMGTPDGACLRENHTLLQNRVSRQEGSRWFELRQPVLPAEGVPVCTKEWWVAFCTIRSMGLTVELHNTGDSQSSAEIRAVIEHVMSDKTGEWRVSIVGSRDNDDWEMKGEGENGFERSYTLAGAVAQHEPEAIRRVLLNCQRLYSPNQTRGCTGNILRTSQAHSSSRKREWCRFPIRSLISTRTSCAR